MESTGKDPGRMLLTANQATAWRISACASRFRDVGVVMVARVLASDEIS